MKPVVLLSSVDHQCATFVWPGDLRFFVGYRFVEHQPMATSGPLPHRSMLQSQPPPIPDDLLPCADEWLDNWQTEYADPENPLRLRFQTFADGSAGASVVENEGLQERTWRFVPEEHGVRMWMSLTTHEPILGGYVVPQCLRLGGGIGFGFRRTVARVPFLSELLMQALGNANGTLTWARNKGRWHPFPVPFTRYHTPAGEGVYADSRGQVDIGLIVRQSASRAEAPSSYWRYVAPDARWDTWSCGLYWQRTAYISNRHPADCLHAGVDLGSLEAGKSRTVAGKFYWIEGTKDDLLAHWREEFREGENVPA